jgi:hypothetical protein
VIDVLEVKTDRGGSGVVVIADGYWPAKTGREALAIEWDTSAVERSAATSSWPSTRRCRKSRAGAQGRYLQAGRRGEENLRRL